MADDREYAWKLFQVLADEGSEYLGERGLEKLLLKAGTSDAEERKRQVPVFLQSMDADGDGKVSFNDFYSHLSRSGLSARSLYNVAESTASTDYEDTEDIKSAVLFDEIDIDGDGYIGRQTLVNAIKRDCQVDDEEEVEEILHNRFKLKRESRISRQQFVKHNQGFIRRNSSIFGLLQARTDAPNTQFTATVNDIKRHEMWSVFCAIDTHDRGVITLSELDDFVNSKAADLLDGDDVDTLRQVSGEQSPETELSFDGLIIKYVVASDPSNSSCNFPEAIRVLSKDNTALHDQIDRLRQEQVTMKKRMEIRASAENIFLENETENVEDKLEDAYNEISLLTRKNKDLEAELKMLRDVAPLTKPSSQVSVTASEGGEEGKGKEDPATLREKVKKLEQEKEDLSQQLEQEKKVKEFSEVSQMGGVNDAHIRVIELEKELERAQEECNDKDRAMYDLTNERDDYKHSYEKISGSAEQPARKEEIEQLQTQLTQSYANTKQLQEEKREIQMELEEVHVGLSVLQEQLEENGIEVDEKWRSHARKSRDLNQMTHEMKTLQATVVANTAALAMEDGQEIDNLQSQLLEQKQEAERARQRAMQAELERDNARAQILQASAIPSDATPQTVQYIQSIAALKKENRGLKKTVKKLHSAYTQALKRPTATSGHPADVALLENEVDKLSNELKDACGEIAQLTFKLNEATQQAEDAQMEALAYRRQQNHFHQNVENEKLKKQLSDVNSRLAGAVNTMKKSRDHACVQVVKTTEKIHTRDYPDGNVVEVSKNDPTIDDMFTYYTNDSVKALKTGRWSDQEDRVLLQSQLHVGADWLEIAKHLPGRSNVEVEKRWKQLTAALVEQAASAHNSRRESHVYDNQPQNGNSLNQHNESVMSQRSEGTYDIASIEQDEAENSGQAQRTRQRARVAV
eukprot:m.102943 g.102943  ORF g.102943 m.102943 type:complete len:918 (-) comp12604_c0_seq1:652-3405(-)